MGCGDIWRLSSGTNISEPPSPTSLNPFLAVLYRLTPGKIRSTEDGIGASSIIGAAGASCKGRFRRSRDTTHSRGECQEEGVFTSGFPHLVKKFIPSHLIPIIPTAGGEVSVAAAHAVDRVRPGGQGDWIKRGRPRLYEYGYDILWE